jgi:hypothetical protein
MKKYLKERNQPERKKLGETNKIKRKRNKE